MELRAKSEIKILASFDALEVLMLSCLDDSGGGGFFFQIDENVAAAAAAAVVDIF